MKISTEDLLGIEIKKEMLTNKPVYLRQSVRYKKNL